MKYTTEQMQLAIDEWQTSGLSKKAFCRDRKITYQTFHYWYKRLTEVPSPGFREVSVQSHEGSAGGEIIFPSGVRMIFYGEPSPSWLREVLR
jgi:hypothetical protein